MFSQPACVPPSTLRRQSYASWNKGDHMQASSTKVLARKLSLRQDGVTMLHWAIETYSMLKALAEVLVRYRVRHGHR